MLSEGDSLNVSKIYRNLGREQNLISHHLACLKNCGLVVAEKQGKQVFYKIRNKKVLKLFKLTDAYIKDILESVLSCEVVSEDKAQGIRRIKQKTA